MTWVHGLGAALLFLGSTAAGFALRRELQLFALLKTFCFLFAAVRGTL